MIEQRMKHPAFLVPGAFDALLALSQATKNRGVPGRTLELVHLRASQINGCSYCVDLHGRDAKKAGETDQRLLAVGAWRDAPFFDDAERAALALTEAVTRMDDRSDPVPDAVWADARKCYEDDALAALIVAIGTINLWNRLNVTTRQIAAVAP